MTADGANAAPAQRSDRVVWVAIALTIGLLVIRLLVIGQFGLYFDEVYYWLWSTQLAAGYYDHPPLIAFTIRLGTILFGETEFGVRFFGAVAMALSAGLTYAIVLTLSDDRRTAAWAAILFNATAAVTASVFVVPDEPMIAFWLAGLLGLARITRGGGPTLWLFSGGMFALAAASKYVAFFLIAGAGLWVLVVPSLRGWLRRPWPWLGASVAIAIFTPVLIWNAQHDWISVAMQLNREPDAPRGLLGYLPDYLLLFPLLATPFVFSLGVLGYSLVLRRGWHRDPVSALLILMPLPLTLYYAYHSLHEKIGEHWAAALVFFIAFAGARAITGEPAKLWLRRTTSFLKWLAVPVGLAAAAVFYVPVLLAPFVPLPRLLDQTARYEGFTEYAAEVEARRLATGAAYIIGRHYSSPAYIRFYFGRAAPAYQLGEFERWANFDGLGTAPAAYAAATGLYIGQWSDAIETVFLARYFNTVTRVADVVQPLRGQEPSHFGAWLVSDPKAAALPLFGLAPPDAAP